jgi:molybdate-binding protein/DNA-binding XRE family transcriptional regulator
VARRAGISRQTVYAIESGSYVPNTAVALRLAKILGVEVEALFRLEDEEAEALEPVRAKLLAAEALERNRPVRLGRVGKEAVAVPVAGAPYYLEDADALMAGGRAEFARIAPHSKGEETLVVAGCDPALGLLVREVERSSGVAVLAAPASSRLALRWLKEGKVHVAGTHLRDPKTGEFNLPVLRKELPMEEYVVVTFAHWEAGLVTPKGNPKGVRFRNREEGTGSRLLLERMLAEAGIPHEKVRGVEQVAKGHMAVALAVANGEADCGIATPAAARAFGLEFVPWEEERFDLVFRKRDLGLVQVQAMLAALESGRLRKRLEMQAGYSTAKTGARL